MAGREGTVNPPSHRWYFYGVRRPGPVDAALLGACQRPRHHEGVELSVTDQRQMETGIAAAECCQSQFMLSMLLRVTASPPFQRLKC